MYVVVTAYVPITDNDITKGGKAIPVIVKGQRQTQKSAFGIRRQFVPDSEGEGIIPVTLAAK